MKNKMAQMMGASMGLSFETAGGEGGGGGAAAVAAPPAGGSSGAPASTGGGSDGGSGNAGFSFMSKLTTRDLTPKEDVVRTDPGATETAETVAADEDINVMAPDGVTVLKTFKASEKAEAEAFAEAERQKLAGTTAEPETKPEEGAVQTLTPETKLPVKIFGRFETIKATEEAFGRAEKELVRLSNLTKTLKAEKDKELVTRDAEIASLKAEIENVRKTPPFTILNEEQEDALGKESPAKLARYLLAKDKHEQALQKAKDDAARSVHDRQKRSEAAQAEIERVVNEMYEKTEEYPMLEAADPIMAEIHDSLGGKNSPLQGDPRAVTLLYYAALGKMYKGVLAKAKTVKKEEAAHVVKTAGAAAQATAGAGAGKTTTGKPAAKDPNADWSKKIDEVGVRRVLRFDD